MILDLIEDEIINLHVYSKERVHHSRSRKGYHVFLSWYFGKYNSLSEEAKHEIFPSSIPTMTFNVNDDKSFESFLTTPAIHLSMVIKVDASLWKSSTREYQDECVQCANRLNMIHLPGSFKKLMTDIFVVGIEYKVSLSLKSD